MNKLDKLYKLCEDENIQIEWVNFNPCILGVYISDKDIPPTTYNQYIYLEIKLPCFQEDKAVTCFLSYFRNITMVIRRGIGYRPTALTLFSPT